VLFIVSEDSVKSEDCLSRLKEAKNANKSIVSIWFHKPKLESSLESLIFRKQLADFSDPAKFNDSVSSLVPGLKKIAMHEEEIEEEQLEINESDDPALAQIDQQDGSHDYIFVVADASDNQIAEEVAKKLTENELKVKRAADSLQHTSKHILHCCALVMLLSSSSLASKKVHDQVALAENHKKPLFPIFLSNSLLLDPAMQYTLALAPKFYFTEECLNQLVHTLQISLRIMHHRTIISQHELNINSTPPATENPTKLKGGIPNGQQSIGQNCSTNSSYWTF